MKTSEKNEDVVQYGYLYYVRPLHDQDACVFVQGAGRYTYNDEDKFWKGMVQTKVQKNVRALAEHCDLVHIYNFDGGDEEDDKATPYTEVYRGNDVDEDVLKSTVAVNGIILEPGESARDAINESFKDPDCDFFASSAPSSSTPTPGASTT